MIVLGGALLGAITGILTARRRKGGALDMAQYGAGYAIAFALVGLVITITVHRMAV